jgi:UDP-GlcNAc:undecaprenyl-phosphate GlcNAc-1-phosphate transferase
VIPAALALLTLSAGLSLAITPIVRRTAERRGWLDRPDGWRKLHDAPVPRVGGVAVFVSFACCAGLLSAVRGAVLPHPGAGPGHLHLLAACALVAAVGLADDIRGVGPWTKLAGQTAAGLYLYAAGYQIAVLSNPFTGEAISLGGLSLPLTLLWFVGVSNAFNLIDGLDGLAAGIGLFSTTTLFVAAVLNQRWEVALLATALAGSLLGFLRYNRSPASIFLGDSGALFVGLALAGLAVRGNMKSSTAIAVATPLLALGVPLLDTSMAVARRVIGGRPVLDPDADHIHHRLLRWGMGPQRVVATLYGVAAIFGALSLLTVTERGQVIGLVLIVTCLATWVGITQLGYGAGGSRRSESVPAPVLRGRFSSAASLEELWRELSTAARDAGFCELVFEPTWEWRELPGEAIRGGRLPSDFPRWQSPEALGDSSAPTLRWNVPVSTDGRRVGTLALTSRSPSTLRSLEDSWVEELSTSFARRWLDLLRSGERLGRAPAAVGGLTRAAGSDAS